ncbi:hypothetical protein HETIRDRAFT_306379 [Heterobasidion irregulare TC 32-1]|uniref:Protein kinase domain-containing protein n=1 Tax=Heterobasidion irregulare (strain TC 32-1) TaxID=747525 RepID=W4KPV3_HETIT|nr:uncharacterized protein HETIRDRAFT_306379 [Heterobasidion irregulare TC 32-1]ETW87744.1 hypothetical protein HETIRDRAFT_306379 [Heterobasidion irregulare TC 32-1]
MAAHGPVTAGGGGMAILRLWTREIASGLAALHALDIVHHALCPAHVLVLPDGHVRIAGLDRAVRGRCCVDPGSTTGAVPRGGRRDSVVLPAGDVALLGLGLDAVEREAPSRDEGEREWEEAPEVLLGWAHGLEVDWWAYGVVVGWMAWGQHPFVGRSERGAGRISSATMRARILKGPVPDDAMGGGSEDIAQGAVKGLVEEVRVVFEIFRHCDVVVSDAPVRCSASSGTRRRGQILNA